jgi:hypothetical protein
MLESRRNILDKLDKSAKTITRTLDGHKLSELILKIRAFLYNAAKVENRYDESDRFEIAHNPAVTGEFQFLISRILYHYSAKHHLDWKVLVDRQQGKTAPGVRIICGDITIAVIDIVEKVGWIQRFFSAERYARDQARIAINNNFADHAKTIQPSRSRLEKYSANFGIKSDQIFFILPTLAPMHRKGSGNGVDHYISHFAAASGLPPQNLILLSDNLNLDLSHRPGDLKPTLNFENMLKRLRELSTLERIDTSDQVVSRGTDIVVRNALKSCAKCGREYSDNNMNYCLDDGTILTIPDDLSLHGLETIAMELK